MLQGACRNTAAVMIQKGASSGTPRQKLPPPEAPAVRRLEIAWLSRHADRAQPNTIVQALSVSACHSKAALKQRVYEPPLV
jgi:hypothetical protein